MAGQTHDRSADPTGQPDGRPDPDRLHILPRPLRFVSIPIAPDQSAVRFPRLQPMPVAVAEPLPPDLLPQPIQTRSMAGLLASLGMSPTETAGLIALLVGLPHGKSPWTLDQINQFLFLREIYHGSWGATECRPAD